MAGKPVTIILEPEEAQLDEVVVTGYQSINRRDMVGSYTTVKAADIMMPAYNSIDQMLQGKIPGMVVVNSSSRIGSSPKITIRGLPLFSETRIRYGSLTVSSSQTHSPLMPAPL